MFFTELEPNIAELAGTGAHFTRLATLAAPSLAATATGCPGQEPRKFRRRLTRRWLKVTREVPDSKLLPVPDWGSQAGCLAVATWGSFGSSGQFTRNPTLDASKLPASPCSARQASSSSSTTGVSGKFGGWSGSKTGALHHNSHRPDIPLAGNLFENGISPKPVNTTFSNTLLTLCIIHVGTVFLPIDPFNSIHFALHFY